MSPPQNKASAPGSTTEPIALKRAISGANLRPPAAITAEIDVSVACPAWRDRYPQVEAVTETAAAAALEAAAGRFAGEHLLLDILLTDDAQQRVLNRSYRGKDASTNVLSFALAGSETPRAPEAPVPLGDVVLAYETVVREAAEQAKPLEHHIQHLVVHGILHLLGFDHEIDTEAEMMEARETEILRRLGVPDPYRDPI